MGGPRKIEIFSGGCPLCEEAIQMVKELTKECGCEITVYDIREKDNKEKARRMNIRSVPSILIDGKLASCCEKRGPDKEKLKEEIGA